MKVTHFMSTHLVTATTSTPLPRIRDLIFQKHVHSVLVVDDKRRLIGIIAEVDLLKKLFPDTVDLTSTDDTDDDVAVRLKKLKHLTVEKVMSREFFFTRPDTNVMRALSRMIVRKVRQLPVLDEDDRLVGIISKGDVFDGLFKHRLKVKAAVR